MLDVLLLRTDPNATRFYRVEIVANLFTEASVIVEWGEVGGRHHRRIACFSDLRAASAAADDYRDRAVARGYVRSAVTPAA